MSVPGAVVQVKVSVESLYQLLEIEYRDTAKPITGEFRKQLHGAILTAYSAEIGRLQAVAAAQERPSIKDQLEAGAKEAASEKAARPPKEKPAKGAER